MSFDDISNSMKKISEQVAGFKGLMNAASSFGPALSKIAALPKLDYYKPSSLMPALPKIKNVKLYDNLRDEREKINTIVSEIYYNTEILFNFRNKIKHNPESSMLVSVSILISILLVIFCIGLPLLVMPVGKEFTIQILWQQLASNIFSIKGLFVGVLTILVCSIFVVLEIKNREMKYSKEDIETLEEWMQLANYSEYLKNYVDNSN